jgi:hypothetical protein
LPALLAASIALGGSCIWGNEYIAPETTKLQKKEHQLFVVLLLQTTKVYNSDVTFCEITHDISATVETICHHACSPPQGLEDGLAVTSFGAKSNIKNAQ